MTNFEQKYQDFREAFKQAALNKELKCKIAKPNNISYNGEMTFYFCDTILSICVADTFVCYYNDIIRGIFNQDDIDKLNEIIKEFFDKDKEKYDRIAELKKELQELEKEIA